jgi:hypothetical protein
MDTLPEKRLLVAILERAAIDALKRGKHARQAREWALEWGREAFTTRFSFPWVCLHLDLCPYSTRRRIESLAVDPTVFLPGTSANVVDLILLQDSDLPEVLLIDPLQR